MNNKSKIIYQSQLGTLIVPYKSKQLMAIEKGTALYDNVYHKWVEYVGFVIPYKGQNAYATFNRSNDELIRHLPIYDIENQPMITPKYMKHEYEIEGISSMRDVQTYMINQIESSKRNNNSWFINLQTASGKTVLAVYLSLQFRYKTWISSFSKGILNQWEETYQNYTNIDKDRILRVTPSILNKILSGDIDPNDYDIFISTLVSLSSYGKKNNDFGVLEDIFNMCGIGLFIIDEAHRNISNIVKINSVVNVKYQLFLSADFSQGDYRKEEMFKKVFKNTTLLIPPRDMRNSLKYTRICLINFNTYPNSIEANEPFNKYGYSSELYANYQFKKKVMIQSLIYMIRSLSNYNNLADNEIIKYRHLVLCSNIKHVDLLTEILNNRFKDHAKIMSYHGNINPELLNEAKNNADIIVATYSSFSTGLDTDNIKYVHSLDQCNKVQDNQAGGRSRPLKDGTNAYYFMYIDNGFPYCKNKLRTRLEYLRYNKAKDEKVYEYFYEPNDNYEEIDEV